MQPGGATQCGTSCVNTANDPNNCGACGATCSAGQVCSNGACAGTCAAGLHLCTFLQTDAGVIDAGLHDGGPVGVTSSLCVDESADPNNCGGCGTVCAAGQLCSNGACATSCQVGLVECNGRCVDPLSNGDYCGASAGCGADGGSSGTSCPSGQVCTTGSNGTGFCATTCAGGQVDCGGTCIDPTSDRDNCGATGDCVNGDVASSAGIACGAGQVCTKDGNGKGTCATSCVAGQIQCGGTCVDPQVSPTYCGAVGTCVADGKTTGGQSDGPGSACAAGQFCSKGACVPNCPTGQIDCAGRCVDPQSDNAFCGASGACTAGTSAAGTDCTQISGTICSSGSCQLTCQVGQINCGGICIDPTSDSLHCGVTAACTGDCVNGVCPSGTVCTTSGNGTPTCAVACAGTQINCGGTCVDPSTNATFCGSKGDCVTTTGDTGNSAGATCAAGSVCASGACTANCGANLSPCGNACVDEQHDPSHCGTCTTVCNLPHASVDACRSGSCAIDTCATGYRDCNGTASDGCEQSVLNDVNNCGGCGNVCPGSNAYCINGACAAGKVAFVTSTSFTGDLGGLTGADAKCQAAATAAHLGGTFLAWIATDADGYPRTNFTQSTVPYYLVNGVELAPNFDALNTTGLSTPLHVTELGTTSGDLYAWTNTFEGYENDDGFDDCYDFTSTTGYASVGYQQATSGYEWQYTTYFDCGELHPLYCFQQ
jgi:hypothetical protein